MTNAKEIYKEDKLLIEKIGSKAINDLFDKLQEKLNLLTTMEQIETCEELLSMYMAGGIKDTLTPLDEDDLQNNCLHNFNDGICKTCGEVQSKAEQIINKLHTSESLK